MENPVFMDGNMQRWTLFLSTFVILAIAVAAPHTSRLMALRKIPLAGSELGSTEKRRMAYLGGARQVYQGGYRKVRRAKEY